MNFIHSGDGPIVCSCCVLLVGLGNFQHNASPNALLRLWIWLESWRFKIFNQVHICRGRISTFTDSLHKKELDSPNRLKVDMLQKRRRATLTPISKRFKINRWMASVCSREKQSGEMRWSNDLVGCFWRKRKNDLRNEPWVGRVENVQSETTAFFQLRSRGVLENVVHLSVLKWCHVCLLAIDSTIGDCGTAQRTTVDHFSASSADSPKK